MPAFLLLVTDELEDQELTKAEIRDRAYEEALAQFVKLDPVKPILGQAFEKDCSAIDHSALTTLWGQATLRGKPFPTLLEKGSDESCAYFNLCLSTLVLENL